MRSSGIRKRQSSAHAPHDPYAIGHVRPAGGRDRLSCQPADLHRGNAADPGSISKEKDISNTFDAHLEWTKDRLQVAVGGG